VRAKRGSDGAPGFEVYAGGGMGRTPLIGAKLRDFLPEPDFLAYMEAILRVYNAMGRRDNIYKARIKILVQALGAAKFTELVEAEFAAMPRERFRLAPEVVAAIEARFGTPRFATLPGRSATFDAAIRDHGDFALWVKTNTHPHREPGYICAVISLKPIGGIPGDATAEQMDAVADLADRYSFSEIRVAHEQNLVLAHVRQDELFALWQAVGPLGLATANIGLVTDIIACPGLDYCDLANARSIPIAQMLSLRFADLARQHDIGELHVNISGCINACAHHHVGHIGILGVDKRGAEAYQITVGGSADENAAIGTLIGPAVAAPQAVDLVEAVVNRYLDRRQTGESFIETFRRIGPAPFKELGHAAAR
jgi:sulfite reductase (NADPH) hemoprotein beta-component